MEDGDLLIRSGSTDFRQHRPVAWQMVSGRRVAIECRYDVLRSGEVGFEVGQYDRREPLVVDPILSYSTYLGGSSGDDIINGIAVDSTGAAIVVGSAGSTDFPVSSGTKQGTGGTLFVSKLAPGGNSLQWSCSSAGVETPQTRRRASPSTVPAQPTLRVPQHHRPSLGRQGPVLPTMTISSSRSDRLLAFSFILGSLVAHRTIQV